ncbi:interferon kappa-like [Puntigrus tetrazona]|uniref:interferon kappa-like n=1 Tax=Puntigrus tetrazona TaxID=1606681 RepID=UPI001C8A18CA|nr:interferon kappa-like [Puntigrus tetrazona]XP_043089940.1 interferon kappa-like [Puntigrus tetrazona]
MADRFTNLPKKRQDISRALEISYSSTFELFKKNRTHCHWKNDAFQDLMEHLNRQAKPRGVQVSSELETLVENFKKLDQFLAQQEFSCCAWETVRQDVLLVMNHFTKMTKTRRRN